MWYYKRWIKQANQLINVLHTAYEHYMTDREYMDELELARTIMRCIDLNDTLYERTWRNMMPKEAHVDMDFYVILRRRLKSRRSESRRCAQIFKQIMQEPDKAKEILRYPYAWAVWDHLTDFFRTRELAFWCNCGATFRDLKRYADWLDWRKRELNRKDKKERGEKIC